jgi:hypothetical protein
MIAEELVVVEGLVIFLRHLGRKEDVMDGVEQGRRRHDRRREERGDARVGVL